MSSDAKSTNQGPVSIIEPLEGRMLLSGAGQVAFLGASSQPAVVAPLAATVKLTTRTALTINIPGTTKYGQSISLTADVTRKSGENITTGVVTFKNGSTVLGTANVIHGHAVINFTDLPVGTNHVTASYNGTKKYLPSTSTTVDHAVSITSTTTALASDSSTTQNMGSIVTYTATVRSIAPSIGQPRGSVQFLDGSTVIATVNVNTKGRAIYQATNFFIGSHTITAKYVGNSGYATSTSSAKSQTIVEGPLNDIGSSEFTATRVAGTGTRVSKSGDTLTVNYTGYLTDGTKFDSSLLPGHSPFSFVLTTGNVIQGWHKGLVGMKVGEQRLLKIPPALAYGSAGQGNIPPNATLYFVVQLLEFAQPKLAVSGGTGQNVDIPAGSAASSAAGTAFGKDKVGNLTPDRSFTLSNIGTATLSFTKNPPITITGANASDFLITSQPDNSGVFKLAFKAKAKGDRIATVNIFTDDPDHPTFSFTITGLGT